MFEGSPSTLPILLRAPSTSTAGLILTAWLIPLTDAGYFLFMLLLFNFSGYVGLPDDESARKPLAGKTPENRYGLYPAGERPTSSASELSFRMFLRFEEPVYAASYYCMSVSSTQIPVAEWGMTGKNELELCLTL